ncbi:MAG: DEAD/DEAH box helicase family protein, partial [Fibrobacterales bacterium]|nr:DEAD/DEAH box helicase family protein [Fibrobacterales bacterium]
MSEEPAPSAARWALVAIPSAMELLPVYAVPPEYGEIGPGQLAEVPLRGRKTPGLVWELLDKPPVDPSKIRPLALPEGWPRLDPLWTEFLKWMSDYYMTSPSRMVDAAFPSWARRMFVSGNFGKRSKRVVEKLDAAPEREEPPELNAEQRRAVEVVLGSEGYAPFLLQGVTGSGKTRVYVELARKTLERGKNCLILVPEISLTKQTRDAFARQIGERVELFHSGLTEGTRKEIWRRVAEGSCRVLLGTRSASLLPMQNLGLVVVDEEHDSS